MRGNKFRTGDVVFHRPSGETWIVAWADETELMWCGWPEGWAKVADCDGVQFCTDQEHWKLIEEIAERPIVQSDSRQARCFHLLEQRRKSQCAEMMHL